VVHPITTNNYSKHCKNLRLINHS